MQSRSLDHVKDLVSRLVHLSLSLRMSGHMKRFRGCMRTVVESELTLLQGACSAEAADYPSYTLELFFGQETIRCEATVSLMGVVQRRLAKQERHRALRRSSWTLRPDAVIHFSASGECVLVSPRVKATVFPRHRWTGCDLACDEVHKVLRQRSGLPCVVWCQARPTFRASVRAICGSGVARLTSSAARWLQWRGRGW